MDSWNSEGPIRWRRLRPLGAEVDHDLSAPLAQGAGRQLVSLLWQHGLILARGQALTMERQREVCGLFGPILLRAGESGYLSTVDAPKVSLSELSFHADAAYTDAPFDALALHAVEVVDDASSTRFVDAAAAWDALSPDLRQTLAHRELEMISPQFDALGGRTCDDPAPVALKRGLHAAVTVNPHNGRPCLWASELQTARVVGLEWEESRRLLHRVFKQAYAPERVLEHKWRNGDLVIWDNIGLQHARGPLREVGRRVLQRVIVGTEGVIPGLPDAA
jgi:taurine dioxygenase